MRSTTTLRNRLLRDQIALIVLVGAALLGSTFMGANRAIERLSSNILDLAVEGTSDELHQFFAPAERGLVMVQAWADAEWFDINQPQLLRRVLGPFLLQNPQFSAAMIADDTGRFLRLERGEGEGWILDALPSEDSGLPGARLVFADADSVPEVLPLDLGWVPRERPWFGGATESPGVHWTEPYRFEQDGGPGITASLEVDSPDARRVVAFDVSLDDLNRFTETVEVSSEGRMVVLTGDGLLLAGSAVPELSGIDLDEVLLRRPLDLGLPLVDAASEALGGDRDLENGPPVRFVSEGREWWGQLRPFDLAGERRLWISVLVPTSDLLGDRNRIRQWILGVIAIALLLAVVRIVVQTRSLTSPVEELVRRSELIRAGDLDDPPPIESALSEVQNLAEAQDRMRQGLRSLMKLESDLQVARQIQQRTFPEALPAAAGFELEGWSRPADETGGDSYDVIGCAVVDGEVVIDPAEVEVVVMMLADATGHGIGPALSVTQVRAMLRMALRSGETLATLVRHLNEQLCADLPQNRFITAWLGVLDVRTAMLTSFSGGQAPLLHYRAASGSVDSLSSDAPPLGLFTSVPMVVPPPIQLEPGDLFVVLSDGFYEAMDPSREEFEEERVADILRRHHDERPAAILDRIKAAVEEFTHGAPYSDDRTAVIVKRLP